LSKNGLSEKEAEEIKMHPIYSKEILTANGIDNKNIINGVLEHHESSNGTGYPFGKTEEDISTYGKIIIIANRFDSLTRNRPYRIKMSVADALNFLERNSELYNVAFLREFIILMSKKNLTCNTVMQ
jgi:HD-GYP domain-containing protein (c-di-GMP phosphodiesterase class II)